MKIVCVMIPESHFAVEILEFGFVEIDVIESLLILSLALVENRLLDIDLLV